MKLKQDYIYDPDVHEARFEPKLLAERFENTRRELSELTNGRDVKLLAVTKTVPVEVINHAIDALGVTAIGENRVQELLEKYDALHSPESGRLEIHLIGSLQTNKVKYIIDKVDMIESVDSEKLAAEIDRQAKKHSRTMDILIEINIGREPQKGGIMPEALDEFVEALAKYDSLRLRGLMTIAPKSDKISDYTTFFTETRRLFDGLAEKMSHNTSVPFDVLSMGMSQSYPAAIECGSTEIRLGSTLFGARQY